MCERERYNWRNENGFTYRYRLACVSIRSIRASVSGQLFCFFFISKHILCECMEREIWIAVHVYECDTQVDGRADRDPVCWVVCRLTRLPRPDLWRLTGGWRTDDSTTSNILRNRLYWTRGTEQCCAIPMFIVHYVFCRLPARKYYGTYYTSSRLHFSEITFVRILTRTFILYVYCLQVICIRARF